MIKTAIFVEGQSELIFVRELILKMFDYQHIWIECYTLFNDINLHPTEYSFRSPESHYYFQILNIGNDKKVISSILRREKFLFGGNAPFQKVIGLRDMYSKEYREMARNAKIDNALNKKFIENHNTTIKTKSSHPEKIRFHFAIMELEAWILGISGLFEKYNQDLSFDTIRIKTNVDLQKADPETEIFHPAETLNKICSIVGDSYDKKKGEVNKFLSLINKENFLHLIESKKCKSFKSFWESVEINAPTVT